jgi:purine-binding chemotaxis protein CheW
MMNVKQGLYKKYSSSHCAEGAHVMLKVTQQILKSTDSSQAVDGRNQILVFTLDESRYALLLSAVDRVVRSVEITPLPKAPEVILGVINVQGEIIPVVDVRNRFHLPARELGVDDRFIIARTWRQRLILVVDSVAGLRELANKDMAAVQNALPYAPYLHGVAKVEDELILIYDLDHFLSIDEEQMLDKAFKDGMV